MMDRRNFVMLSGGMIALSACGGAPPGAAQVTLNATGGAGMNPGPDGSDRPVTVAILQLRNADAFNAADVFALQDPASALGADLISADQLAVAPGGSASKTVVADMSATFIGLVAGFRDPAGKTYKGGVPVAPGDVKTATLTLGPSGMAVG